MLQNKPATQHSPANKKLPATGQADSADSHSPPSIGEKIIKELKTLHQSFIEYAKKVEL